MKPSSYNNYILLEDGNYVVHNRLTGAIFIADEDTKKAIEFIQEGTLPQEQLEAFQQNGVLIEDNENELLRIRHRYNAARYNPQTLSFIVAPTTRCNLSCHYCIQRADESLIQKEAQTATMSESTTRNVLSFVKSMTERCNIKLLPITFYGGEPLTAKGLIFCMLEELAKWSKEHSIGLGTAFFTNGTLLDQSFLDKLQKYTILYARTTLDGPKEIHDQYRHYRNGKGTYEKVLDAIEMLLDAGIQVRVQTNINRHYTHMPALFDDLNERGLTRILVEPYPLFDYMTAIPEAQEHYGILSGSIPVPESTFAVPFKDIPEARTFIYRAAFKRGFKLPTSSVKAWAPCGGANAYHFLVDPLGDVYKCLGSMLVKNMRIGHIHENGRFEQFPFFYEWMNTDPTLIDKCQPCQFLPSCGGGCIVGRYLIGLPCFCEYSFFRGEEYLKMCLKQAYPELLESLKIE